jgi:hypothetical protein
MGIDSDSISFEKIEILKDLEIARMNLNTLSNENIEHNDALEEEILPLNEHNILEWGSEESDVEPIVVVHNVRKSRFVKKKGNRKARVSKNPPVEDSANPGGDKPKVSPRFNLRDIKSIKKVL